MQTRQRMSGKARSRLSWRPNGTAQPPDVHRSVLIVFARYGFGNAVMTVLARAARVSGQTLRARISIEPGATG